MAIIKYSRFLDHLLSTSGPAFDQLQDTSEVDAPDPDQKDRPTAAGNESIGRPLDFGLGGAGLGS